MRKFYVVLVLAAIAAGSIPASALASTAVTVIPFEKHAVGPGHYVGTAGDDGTIEMFVYDSSVTGDVQHFTATVLLSVPEGSLTAILDGRFSFNTGRVVLNGSVVEGWLKGARVHEESQLVGLDPLTFVGTVQLMPSSAK
ncbi:MAG TPA: hypothetical protein VM848_01820 [Acidimicrobiia bacterium]|nr:hypothetical protein [Acidimicrobiia bacterium]